MTLLNPWLVGGVAGMSKLKFKVFLSLFSIPGNRLISSGLKSSIVNFLGVVELYDMHFFSDTLISSTTTSQLLLTFTITSTFWPATKPVADNSKLK